MPSNGENVSSSDELPTELATLLFRLGFAAVVRHPDTDEVLAASPAAHQALMAAEAGSIRSAAVQIGGSPLVVDVVRLGGDPDIELTPRQAAVAALLAEGLRNREIAERLAISTHTVRRHLESIFRRLGVPNRTAAAAELRKAKLRG